MDDLMIERILSYAGDSKEIVLRGEMEPRARRYRLVSVDDHLTEPPDLFEGRVPRKFEDLAPRVERDAAGIDWWVFSDDRVPLLAVDSYQGFDPDHAYIGPVNFDELHPAAYDIRERVKHMDVIGLEASLNFPSAPFGFAGTRFMRMGDEELGLASLRAFNEWHLEVWAGTVPGRIIANQLPWLLDPEVAAEEIRANAERGFRAVSFSENPEKLGLPSLYTTHWDPFFAACEETGTVINLHIGSSSETVIPSTDSAPPVIGALFPINGMATAADWLFAGIPLRFPNLKIALSEAGIGWVPMFIDRVEHMGRMVDYSAQFGDLDPIDVLRRNFWFTTFNDERTLPLRHLVGVENIMLETDYPHTDSTWPDTQEILTLQLKDVPDDEADAITHGNAVELYGLEELVDVASN